MSKNQSQDILQLFSLYTFCYLIFLCLQNVMISPIFLFILDNLLQCYKHQFLYILNNMLQQQLQILENISNVSKHQNVLLKTPQNAQQQFFHLWAHRSLIKQKFMHPKVEQTLLYLPGTFSNQALHHQYMLYCIQNKIELTSDNFPLIEKLITWTEQYPTFKAKSPISLTNIVFDNNSYDVFNNINTLITFIDVISPDIIKLIRKKGKINESQPQKVQQYHVNMLTADDLILFLTIVLPKVLFNLLLQNRLLPGQEKNQNKSIQCLYKLSSVQFYLKTKNNYYSLIRTLIKILLSFQLKPPQQKKLMESIFNYFYAYHHDKKSHSTDYFIEAYNQLDQTTRFALSDQFLLFFRIIKKVGKGKFLNFLLQKSPWLKQISNKISDNLLIGYPKDNLVPFNVCHMIGQGMVVNNGSKQYRYFEILQQYSTFYYKIGIKSQDITVRLYYLGQFDKKTSRKFLLQHQKLSGQKTNNVLAVKKGLYMFQFDNSYSWINKKVIRYQNVILNPLQLKSTDPAKWINSFYQNIQGNQAIKDIITILLKPIKKKQQKKYQGTCNISKNGPFFNLKLTKANKIYEFQSQTQQKLIKKFNELLQSQKNINWLVDSQPLDTDEAVLNKIKGYPNQKGKNMNEENPINNKKEQKISQNVNQADKIDIQGASFNQTAEQQ